MSLVCGCLSKNPDKAIPKGITWGLIEIQDFKLQKFLEHRQYIIPVPLPVYHLKMTHWKIKSKLVVETMMKIARNERSLETQKDSKLFIMWTRNGHFEKWPKVSKKRNPGM